MDGSEALNEDWEPIQHQNSVVIRDDYFPNESSVFPPTHHEDLPVAAPDIQSPDESSPSSPSSTSEAGSGSSERRPAAPDLRARVVAETMRCLRSSCEVVKAKVISRILRFRSSAASLWSVLPVTAMAAFLLLFLFYLKMQLPWRRRTVHRGNDDRLLIVIKQKDEKISQLLLQIAQMNESLSARRRVPVVRIK